MVDFCHFGGGGSKKVLFLIWLRHPKNYAPPPKPAAPWSFKLPTKLFQYVCISTFNKVLYFVYAAYSKHRYLT